MRFTDLLVIKSEKLVLKQYILSQKGTKNPKNQPRKLKKITQPPKREKEYCDSDDSGYSSD